MKGYLSSKVYPSIHPMLFSQFSTGKKEVRSGNKVWWQCSVVSLVSLDMTRAHNARLTPLGYGRTTDSNSNLMATRAHLRASTHS